MENLEKSNEGTSGAAELKAVRRLRDKPKKGATRMTWERLFYKGGNALVIGAVLEVIGIGLYILTLIVPLIPGIVFASLLSVADVLTFFGIFAWYGSQMVETGTLGFNGFVVVVTGLLLGISKFFTPYIWLLYLVGLAMLAKANSRANRYPTNNAWFWLVGSTITLSGSVVGILALIGLGTAISCFGRYQLGKSIMAKFIQDGH